MGWTLYYREMFNVSGLLNSSTQRRSRRDLTE
jgi:hypothetical protein